MTGTVVSWDGRHLGFTTLTERLTRAGDIQPPV
jgi:hypothetical protein